MDIRNFIKGWTNVILKDEQIEAIAAARLEVCNTCPLKVKQLSLDVCSECGCPLVAKTRSPDSKCPLDKW